MRLPNWKTCAGYLVVIAALALSLPGVRAVRADEEIPVIPVISVNLVDSAPSCDPGAESGAARSVALFLEGASDRSGAPHPVALNTQGYSYRPPSVDPEARRLERR